MLRWRARTGETRGDYWQPSTLPKSIMTVSTIPGPAMRGSSHGILLSGGRLASENRIELVVSLAGRPIGGPCGAGIRIALLCGSLPILGRGFERAEANIPSHGED